jgi:hypothetical protein
MSNPVSTSVIVARGVLVFMWVAFFGLMVLGSTCEAVHEYATCGSKVAARFFIAYGVSMIVMMPLAVVGYLVARDN